MSDSQRNRTKLLQGAVLLATVLALAIPASAEQYALLVGIGDYPDPSLPGVPELRKLDGPRFDVEALQQELVRQGLRRDRIFTLVDEQATRRAILEHLEYLATNSRPGDSIFFYYSGHGTSAYDQDHVGEHGLLNPQTGALLPYDFYLNLAPNTTPEQWAQRLIIGRTDLRPRLETLDRDRDVFVVFDTCYSGSAVRSISGRARSYQSPYASTGILLADPFGKSQFGTATRRQSEEPYPYDRLVYISAARVTEQAYDASNRETLDGNPHGIFTDGLLRALRGDGDLNRDGGITYRELHDFVKAYVADSNYQQTPQILFPARRPGVLDRHVFRGVDRPGFEVVGGGPSSGDPSSNELRDVLVRNLVDLGFSDPDFRLRLDVPGYRGTLYREEAFEIVADASRPTVLVLLSIVPSVGTVTVLYPVSDSETQPTSQLRERFRTRPPYGTEYLKLFALYRAPAALRQFFNQKIDVLDPRFEELYGMLSDPGIAGAETRLRIETRDELALSRRRLPR